MNRMKVAILGAAMASAAGLGAVAASVLGNGRIFASADTATPSPSGSASPSASASPGSSTAPNTTAPSTGTFKSNEDPTHEGTESAAREADENSGKAHLGRPGGGSNENPAHEATEGAAREGQEAPTTAATPAPSQ
jgi:hypothetical protein